jgi:hypothetical protein
MKYYKNDGIPIKNLKYDKVVGKYIRIFGIV